MTTITIAAMVPMKVKNVTLNTKRAQQTNLLAKTLNVSEVSTDAMEKTIVEIILTK